MRVYVYLIGRTMSPGHSTRIIVRASTEFAAEIEAKVQAKKLGYDGEAKLIETRPVDL